MAVVETVDVAVVRSQPHAESNNARASYAAFNSATKDSHALLFVNSSKLTPNHGW